MKKYYILLLPLLSVIYLSSCDKYLDVDPDNRAEVDNKEKIAGMLVSAYPTSTFCFITEMASDNADRMDKYIQYDNRRQEEFFYWKDATEISTDTPHVLWQACYKAIASANQALDAIKKLGNDDGSLNTQKGEALMCRAYAHFVLVNVFCMHYGSASSTDPGVPYMEAPETTVNPKYERGTVAGVYAKIEADIEEGLPLINDDEFKVLRYHFNKKAAYAFAARFFLYYRKYDKVISYASEVLGGDPVSALRNWGDAAIVSTTYDVRGNAFVDSDNKANLLLIPTYSLWGRHDGPYYTGCYYIHNNTISAYETDRSVGPWGNGSVANTYKSRAIYLTVDKVCNYKIKEFFEYTDPVQGIGYAHIVHPVFTTDETLLCRAEAYVMTKEYDKACDDLSLFMRNYSNGTILTRENMNAFYENLEYYQPGYDAATKIPLATPKKKLNPDFVVEQGEQENLIHCVLHIRRILTRSEGLRWFDVKRYGIEIYRRSITENNSKPITPDLDFLAADDLRRAIQLPMDVINAGLPANPRNE